MSDYKSLKVANDQCRNLRATIRNLRKKLIERDDVSRQILWALRHLTPHCDKWHLKPNQSCHCSVCGLAHVAPKLKEWGLE